MKPSKSKAPIYLILLIGLPIALAAAGWFGELLLVDKLSDPSNPQDSSGWLALLAPITALIGAVVGLVVGGVVSIVISVRNRR